MLKNNSRTMFINLSIQRKYSIVDYNTILAIQSFEYIKMNDVNILPNQNLRTTRR